MFSSRLIKSLAALSVFLGLVFLGYSVAPWLSTSAPFARAVKKTEQIQLTHGAFRLHLTKEAGMWRIRSLARLPAADQGKVRTLLDTLEAVRVQDVISERSDRAGDFEVDAASGTQVTLLDRNGRGVADGIFGKQAPDFSHIYFRFPEHPTIYLAQGIIRGELGNNTLRDWRDRQLLNLKEDQIQALQISGPDFQTRLVMISSDVWTCNGKKAEPHYVAFLKQAVARLTADDFVDLSARPDLTPDHLILAQVQIEMKGREKHQIRFGKPDPIDKRTPIVVDQGTDVAWILEVQKSSLLKRPETYDMK